MGIVVKFGINTTLVVFIYLFIYYQCTTREGTVQKASLYKVLS